MINERPFTVTLVCLYLLLVGSLMLVMSFTYLQDPKAQEIMAQIDLPYHAQVTIFYLNFLVMVVSAMFMFQEHNWARWLYLGWGLFHLAYAYYIQLDFNVNWLETVTFPLFAILLLLPNANAYFSNEIKFVD